MKQDTWKHEKRLVSLHGMPVVDSDSSMRRAMKRHEEHASRKGRDVKLVSP